MTLNHKHCCHHYGTLHFVDATDEKNQKNNRVLCMCCLMCGHTAIGDNEVTIDHECVTSFLFFITIARRYMTTCFVSVPIWKTWNQVVFGIFVCEVQL